MKKNIILLSTLILLVGGTYFLEEKKMRFFSHNSPLSELDLQLPTDTEKLLQFDLNHLQIKKVGEHFFFAPSLYPVDEKLLWKVFDKLGRIRLQRIITAEEKKILVATEIFPPQLGKMEFVFAQERISYGLGKRLDFSDSFYMEVKVLKKGKSEEQKHWVIAHDVGGSEEIYKSEQEYFAEKYIQVQSVFLLEAPALLDRRVLHPHFVSEFTTQKWDWLKSQHLHHREFTLDWKNQTTHPAIFPSLSYDLQAMENWRQHLLGLQAQHIHLHPQRHLLQQKEVTLQLQVSSGQHHTLTLYKSYQGKTGHFVATDFAPVVYEIYPQDTSYFYVNEQDFWDKRIFKISQQKLQPEKDQQQMQPQLLQQQQQLQQPEQSQQPQEESLTLNFAGKTTLTLWVRPLPLQQFYTAFHPQKNKAQVDTSQLQIKQKKMQKLLQLLYSLPPFAQFSRVALLSANEMQEWQKKYHSQSMLLSFKGKNLFLTQADGDIVLLDLNTRVGHFYSSLPLGENYGAIGVNMSDYVSFVES